MHGTKAPSGPPGPTITALAPRRGFVRVKNAQQSCSFWAKLCIVGLNYALSTVPMVGLRYGLVGCEWNESEGIFLNILLCPQKDSDMIPSLYKYLYIVAVK